jgi:hypothetical protein
MQVWDHVISNDPHFWPLVVISYLRLHRRTLLAADSVLNCPALSSHPPPVDTNRLLRTAYSSLKETPVHLWPPSSFQPLHAPGGVYEPFKAYPTGALAVHRSDRRRMMDAAVGLRVRERTVAEMEVGLPRTIQRVAHCAMLMFLIASAGIQHITNTYRNPLLTCMALSQ